MYSVDQINGNDQDFSNGFQRLEKAIERCISGDNIFLNPGTYIPIKLSSLVDNFELFLGGSGNNTICNGFIFEGYLDITIENMALQNIEINCNGADFRFKNCKFIGMRELKITSFSKNSHDEKIYLTFDNCRFEKNFQIKSENLNNCTISLKSCEYKGEIPLIYSNKSELNIRVSNMDFEHILLSNKRSIIEIFHVCCNFNCPIFSGDNCLVVTKDYYRSPSMLTFNNSPGIFIKSNEEKTENENYDRLIERYGGIEINSDEFSFLNIHRLTTFIRVTGNGELNLILPENPINGKLTQVFSNGNIKIDGKIFPGNLTNIVWTISGGWFVF